MRRHLDICGVSNRASMSNTINGDNNRLTVNQTVNVNIIVPTEFGREDVTELIEADWKKVGGVKSDRQIVSALVNYLNCNDERPQNHNVLVPNEKSESAYVFSQSNWRQRSCDDTMRDCISNMSLKAQDALEDVDFQKYNPTPRARLDACIKTLEELATQADKSDSSIVQDVETVKSVIATFTQRHPELLSVAVRQAAEAPPPLRYRKSVVMKAYGPGGQRRSELLEALAEGRDIPPLRLSDL